MEAILIEGQDSMRLGSLPYHWLTSFKQGFRYWNQQAPLVDEDGFQTVHHGEVVDLIKDWLAADLVRDQRSRRLLCSKSTAI